MNRPVRVLGLMALIALGVSSAEGWSGGPLRNVTDLEPKCAVCHSSTSKEQMRVDPPGMANALVAENRHLKPLQEGRGAYEAMSAADRERLAADVEAMDDKASVTLTMPTAVRAGQEIQITVAATGGSKFLGLALVDTDLRGYARPIQSDGWGIVGPPQVWGSDGKGQTDWIDKRPAGLGKNINSAVVFDQPANLAAGKVAGGRAAWTVSAPQKPGTYTVVAVLFYGTEKASPVGSTTTPTGAVLPRGGTFGPSGRIMFSKPVTVAVR